MTYFTPIEENKAKGKVKRVFNNIKKERKINAIPNFWKTIANDPDTLERTWNSLKDIMKKGALDPLIKEMIYIAVSILFPADGFRELEELIQAEDALRKAADKYLAQQRLERIRKKQANIRDCLHQDWP